MLKLPTTGRPRSPASAPRWRGPRAPTSRRLGEPAELPERGAARARACGPAAGRRRAPRRATPPRASTTSMRACSPSGTSARAELVAEVDGEGARARRLSGRWPSAASARSNQPTASPAARRASRPRRRRRGSTRRRAPTPRRGRRGGRGARSGSAEAGRLELLDRLDDARVHGAPRSWSRLS